MRFTDASFRAVSWLWTLVALLMAAATVDVLVELVATVYGERSVSGGLIHMAGSLAALGGLRWLHRRLNVQRAYGPRGRFGSR